MDEGRSRLRIFVALIAVVLGILFLRLGKLQIIERSDHTGKSTANAVRERRVQPPRGRFYDRNGVLLVENEPSFTLYVTPRYFDPTTIPLLSSLVMVPDSVIQQRFRSCQQGTISAFTIAASHNVRGVESRSRTTPQSARGRL